MSFSLRQLTLAVALCGLANTTFAADSAKPLHVLASLPITYGLGEVLLKGTHVNLERAAPANLPGSRQSAYFTGRGAPALAKLATDADAVIGVRSLWADDSLYPISRRSNIRIVEIDAARPVDGALPGIAVTGDDAYGAYPWLNPTNLGRMADVVANDLERLSPADKAKIQGNLAGLKRQLLELTANSQTQLAEVDNLTVVSLSERLGYLASGLNLDVVEQALPAEGKWDEAALKALGDNLKNQDVALVLDHRQPDAAVAEVIKASGATLLVVESDADDAVAGLKASVEQVVGALTES